MENYSKKKFKVKLRSLFTKIDTNKPELSEMQKKSMSIFRKMVINKKSTLLVDPINLNCYVEYEHYFVKLNSTSLLIRNTNFTNYCEFDFRVGEKLVNFFNRNVSMRRIAMESVYEQNMLKVLEKIIKELK